MLLCVFESGPVSRRPLCRPAGDLIEACVRCPTQPCPGRSVHLEERRVGHARDDCGRVDTHKDVTRRRRARPSRRAGSAAVSAERRLPATAPCTRWAQGSGRPPSRSRGRQLRGRPGPLPAGRRRRGVRVRAAATGRAPPRQERPDRRRPGGAAAAQRRAARPARAAAARARTCVCSCSSGAALIRRAPRPSTSSSGARDRPRTAPRPLARL